MKRDAMFLQSQLAEAVGPYASALDCVYLFGSQARGNAGPLSDVDIGLLFSEAVPRGRRGEIQLQLISHLQKVNGPHIDVVILNEAPPFLRHRVIRDGRVLYCADERRRVAFEVRAIREYLDFKPYLDLHYREQITRIREGRFGR